MKRLRTAVALLTAATGFSVACLDGRVIGKTTGPKYAVTDLGAAYAIKVSNPDSSGEFFIAGTETGANGLANAIVWKVTTAGAILSVSDLGTLPGTTSSSASDVNDAGAVVGTCDNSTNVSTGFVDLVGVGMVSLPTLGGTDSFALAVNNGGEIVGWARDASGTGQGAIWHVDATGAITGPVNLGAFFPNDINDNGEMTGYDGADAAIAAFDANGVLQVTSIGTLPGAVNAEANAINNLGEVVGSSSTEITSLSYLVSGFLWTAAGGMSDIGNLGKDQYTVANDVNDNLQIVGTSSIHGNQGIDHGFIWQNGVMTDLNNVLSSTISSAIIRANGINGTGQIVGILSNGHAGLLVPQ